VTKLNPTCFGLTKFSVLSELLKQENEFYVICDIKKLKCGICYDYHYWYVVCAYTDHMKKKLNAIVYICNLGKFLF